MRTGVPDPEASIVLFDGHCNLCCGSVRFISDRDPHARFRFASLQSKAAGKLLALHGGLVQPADPASAVLLQHGRAYTRSAAALRIARGLRFPWSLCYVLILLPRPLRDALYSFVAARRYRWFGRRESCMIPTPDLRGRFVEDPA